jgi:hypothetical protein|tara:strand:- start:616 stop:945 length:330 start_codon:yes stop_codon:yes gene_type:complete
MTTAAQTTTTTDMLLPFQFSLERHTDPDGTRRTRAEARNGDVVIILTRPLVGCQRVLLKVEEGTDECPASVFEEGQYAMDWINKYTDGGFGQGPRKLNWLYFQHYGKCA